MHAVVAHVEERTVRLPQLPSREVLRLRQHRAAAAVALEIGADAVVALQPAAEGDRIRRAIVHPLPAGLVVDGEVVDPAGLATELQALFTEHKLPRVVRIGLAHPRLMVRLVELPSTVSGSELDSAVRHLATDLLPVGLDQLVVDYRRVGRAPADRLQRILMAAVRVDSIDSLIAALDGAGLELQGIALSGLAMLAALEHDERPGEAVVYVQAGAITNVVIAEQRQPLLVRAASAGSESIAMGLAERAAISHEDARRHVSSLGLGPAPFHGSPAPISEKLQATVTKQVREGLRRVVAEVQSSRGVYETRPDACPIGAVVLTGSMTAWPGVAAALERDLGLPVLTSDRRSWPQGGALQAAPERLDVVMGLAAMPPGERPDLRPARAGASSSAPLSPVAQAACALVALLAALVVYLVVIANQIGSGREELGTLSGELVAAEGQAAALKPYHDFATATKARRAAVVSVADGRFNWDRALTQLSQVAPGGVWLTSAKGTLTPSTAIDGGPGDGTTGTLRGALSVPALELSGCAERDGLVPTYIDRLHAITGVTEVGFSRSERLTKAAGSGGGAGDCRNGDARAAQFALVAYFKPAPGAPGAPAAKPAAKPADKPATAAAPPGSGAPSATASADATAAVSR